MVLNINYHNSQLYIHLFELDMINPIKKIRTQLYVKLL